jgi:hypothetical protein
MCNLRQPCRPRSPDAEKIIYPGPPVMVGFVRIAGGFVDSPGLLLLFGCERCFHGTLES